MSIAMRTNDASAGSRSLSPISKTVSIIERIVNTIVSTRGTAWGKNKKLWTGRTRSTENSRTMSLQLALDEQLDVTAERLRDVSYVGNGRAEARELFGQRA